MNSLIEKMAKRICRQSCPFTSFGSNCEHQCMATSFGLQTRGIARLAEDALTDVLDHFSDPENITEDGMARAATEAGIRYNLMKSPYQDGERNIRWQWRFRIAMAMKAAKEEMK